jgi:uncharacterized membrane protein
MAPQKRPPPPTSRLIRFARLHRTLLSAIVVGLVILFWPLPFRLPTHLLIGWDAGIAFYLALMFRMMWRADVARIRRRAGEQDAGAHLILILCLVATLASLIAIAFELGGTKTALPGHAFTKALLAMLTIVLSWAFMHTIFSLHYAHEYYGEGRDRKFGGLKFPGGQEPDYRDFLYFSLVIGMTSQVSDVAITSKVIRRMAALHGALSFFFNLTVLALTVNMISNLL